MIELNEIVKYCDERTRRGDFSDFPQAYNGLQVENSGKVTKIGAAVDAGFLPIQKAVEQGIDFLIVHHGLFWSPPQPITGVNYKKLKALFDGNLALYSNHLPLDAHPEIGNNAGIANCLGVKAIDRFLEHEGETIGIITEPLESREALKSKLDEIFPKTMTSMEFGSETPKKIAISSGSGTVPIEEITKLGIDTLITGELRQHHFNMAQELELNVYACGHYATEVFGVQSLAKELSNKFQIPWEFIDTGCRL